MPSHPLGTFQPCPTCCVVGCVYESDNFDRENNTDLGAKWTETAGNPEILDQALAFVAQADAKATCTTIHPTPSNKYIVSATVKFTADGDIARVWISDSEYFVELERINASCGRVRIYDNTGASPVCKGSSGGSLSPWARVAICSEEDKIHISVGGSFPLTIPATVTSSIVAVGTAACTGTVSFEDFSLSKHFSDDATCPACGSEGCTWFSDNGCGGTVPSPTDYTVTGTWSGGLRCTADGTLTILTANPLASQKCRFAFKITERPDAGTLDGTLVKVYLDGSDAHIEAEVVQLGSWWFYKSAWKVRLYSGGIQYGATRWVMFQQSTTFELCWDGSTLSASGLAGMNWYTLGSAPASITTIAPRIEVSSLPGGQYLTFDWITGTKLTSDVAGCQDCAPCTICSPGTWLHTAKVDFAGLTSTLYGCACSDFSLNLEATDNISFSLGMPACAFWVGQPTLCGYLYNVRAIVTAVTGGYKLSVTLQFGTGTATFETTVLGASVDCGTAFDGNIPFVSWTGTYPCDWSAATCTFTSPAP